MAQLTKNNIINYYNKDFFSIRQDLINYSKTYFPTYGTDFTAASPGMMFIDMVSYIGDILSFYIDKQINETFIQTATERENIVQLSNLLGYTHKNITPSFVTLDVFQLVPSVNGESPDLRYALKINEGAIINTNNGSGISFRTLEDINFAITASDGSGVSVYTTVADVPSRYMLNKKVKASSTMLITQNFYIASDAAPNCSIKIDRTDVVEILDVIDSNGNKWYEVPSLSQQFIPVMEKNEYVNSDLYVYEDETPYLLNYIVATKKFIKRVNSDDTTELIFGSGISTNVDTEYFVNQENINSGFEVSPINTRVLNNFNFMNLQASGEIPRDVTLTVRYYVGGGYLSNVSTETITEIQSVEYKEMVTTGMDLVLLQECKNSLLFTNLEPSQGGRSSESDEEIRQNAMTFFNAQNRCVTAQDYAIRALSLPQKLGNIAKAFVTSDASVGENMQNQLGYINLYCISYDMNKNFVQLNSATKYNLKMYLNNYRILTDSIVIKETAIINIGIKFEIVVLKNYNQNEVLTKCILELKNYFNNDNMQINKPIYLSEIYNLISLVDGVQSVKSVNVLNKRNGAYSILAYNIENATKNGVIYPAIGNSIFEVKYPNTDIEGIVVNY